VVRDRDRPIEEKTAVRESNRLEEGEEEEDGRR